jgi:hypothetical protein
MITKEKLINALEKRGVRYEDSGDAVIVRFKDILKGEEFSLDTLHDWLYDLAYEVGFDAETEKALEEQTDQFIFFFTGEE